MEPSALGNGFTARELDDRAEMMESATLELEAARSSLIETAGDPEELNWKKIGKVPGFSFGALYKKAKASLYEASNVSSANGQLFRYGIQRVLFDGYKDVPVVYPDLCQFVSSQNRQEWYAPTYGAELPEDVDFGEKFDDSRIKGMDVVGVNKKVGRMLTIESEMFKWDQTGQIVNKASQIGKRVRYKEEIDVMTAIKLALYSALLGNYSGSDTALTQNSLETADQALYDMVDPLGNNMLVVPTLLLTGTGNKFVAAKLLNSTLQPSVPTGTPGGTGAGDVGWTMTINPLQSLYSLRVSRFAGKTNVFLMEPKTSIVFQEASPVEVVQENPNAGTSFEQDVLRWRIKRLYAVLVLESRYIYAINKATA